MFGLERCSGPSFAKLVPYLRSQEYAIKELASDIQALVQHCGVDSAAAVVGHDWGAAVVWEFGHTYPQVRRGLVVARGTRMDIHAWILGI